MVSHESVPTVSTCLQLVLIRISTHLCPHHGSSWLPHSGGCLGARQPFFTGWKLDLLLFSGRGVCELKCQPVGPSLGPCQSMFHRLQPWGVGGCRGEDREEGLGTGRALRKGLGECAGGEQRCHEDRRSPRDKGSLVGSPLAQPRLPLHSSLEP